MEHPSTPERLSALLLCQLVNAATRGACIHQMQAIGRYLRQLSQDPAAGQLLRETCAMLDGHWARHLAAAASAPDDGDAADAPMTIERRAIERSVH